MSLRINNNETKITIRSNAQMKEDLIRKAEAENKNMAEKIRELIVDYIKD